MNDMRKFTSILATVAILVSILSSMMVTVAQADVSLPMPEVGVMKVKPNGYNHAVGLRTNGTINAFGYDNASEYSNLFFNRVQGITDVIDVACTDDAVYALKSNGRVEVIPHYENYERNDYYSKKYVAARNWDNIVAIETGNDHIVGLKSNGTVVAAGQNTQGECDVEGFLDIVSIYARENSTIGIDKFGRVWTAGDIKVASEVEVWTDVKEAIYSANVMYGLKNDGSIVTAHTYTYMSGSYYDNLSEKIKLSGQKLVPAVEIGKIVDIDALAHDRLHVVDDKGNGYIYQIYGGDIKQIVADTTIDSVRCDGNYYYFLDSNGRIRSDKATFRSQDWILTTNITFNGVKVGADVPPYIKEGRTLAPMRAILEALEMEVSWDPATKTATAVKADVTISVTIDSNVAWVNGEQKILDVPAEITNSRTFVPVRFFGEALGMIVDWDAATKTVIIKSN